MIRLIRIQKVSQGEYPGKLTLESTMKEGFSKKKKNKPLWFCTQGKQKKESRTE